MPIHLPRRRRVIGIAGAKLHCAVCRTLDSAPTRVPTINSIADCLVGLATKPSARLSDFSYLCV